MQSLVQKWIFVYATGICLIILPACGPQSGPLKSMKAKQIEEIKYENVAATPTVVVPQTAKQKNILNNNKTEIILGAAELKNTKISYNSIDQKMLIVGHVSIVNQSSEGRKEVVAEKDFALSGIHQKNQSSFILSDDIMPSAEKKLMVKAEARCLTITENGNANCNHVMVDLYFFHNGKYYTEQIEVNRTATNTEPNPVPNPNQQILPPPAAEIVQQESEDQLYTQQSENSDDSINGRYQGGAETIDLDQLFSKNDKPTDKPTDKLLNPNLLQTKNGEIRPINQSFGFPDNGFLRHATSLLLRQLALDKKAFFEVVVPDRKKYFATYEMAEMITRIGELLHQQYTKKLFVANLSAINGGKLKPHVSHQNGLDADFGYPTDLPGIKFPLVVRMSDRAYFPKNYSLEKTYALLKYLFSENDIAVDRIFLDKKIKQALCDHAIAQNELRAEEKERIQYMFTNLQHVDGHGDHFHLRIKCSKLDPACRSRIYKKIEGCSASQPVN